MNELFEPLLTMLISLVVLLVSSHVAIKNIVKLSEITSLGKSRIGFTFVATSTSLPELAVAIFAAAAGEAAVSIGNVLGSNIANVCLIIGLGLIIYSLKTGTKKLIALKFKSEELDLIYLGIFTASIVPILLITFLPASQTIGLLLIAIFVYQNFKIISKKEMPLEGSEGPIEKEVTNKRRALMLCLILAFLGIIGILVSADFLVNSMVKIALLVGIPSFIISATILAVGTSFPELSLGVHAMLKGHADLALGNAIGSCLTNITLILGVTLLFFPVRINIKVFSDLITFSILSNIILWYMLHKGNLGMREGLFLLLIYVLFIASIMEILILPEGFL